MSGAAPFTTAALGPAPPRQIALVAALTLVPLLPFLDTAVSLDGPVFMAVARRILEAPFDPFGFEMLWDSTSLAAAEFNRNPPLVSYYLSLWMLGFGQNEVALHSAMLIFPLLASLSFFGIARRLAPAGLAPTALLVVTPAFHVLAASFLLDVPVLAFMLFSVYGLLRGAESYWPPWLIAAGLAAAAAGLSKYVGFCILPLLGAGVVLFYEKRALPSLALLGTPLVIWAAWGAFTSHVYGEIHFLGAMDVVSDKVFRASHFLNKTLSTPLYYGAALLFPVIVWARGLLPRSVGTEVAVVGVLVGVATASFVLPGGQPPRRIALGSDEALIAALGVAGGISVLWLLLDPRRALRTPVDRFLALWLGGLVVFTAFLNWHVNAADALLAAPPMLLLLFRSDALRPTARSAALWVACMLPLSFLLGWADAGQANHYREIARKVAIEIGDQPGNRWFVGHWGLQHYLEREGFAPVVPPALGRTVLAEGDWIVSARNVSQLDVYSTLAPYTFRAVWTWRLESWLPLRTTNGDAGAGFYSHHSGYAPFAWSDAPVEVITLGRVIAQ